MTKIRISGTSRSEARLASRQNRSEKRVRTPAPLQTAELVIQKTGFRNRKRRPKTDKRRSDYKRRALCKNKWPPRFDSTDKGEKGRGKPAVQWGQTQANRESARTRLSQMPARSSSIDEENRGRRQKDFRTRFAW